MRRISLRGPVFIALAWATLTLPPCLQAQNPPQAAPNKEQLTTYAKAHAAIALIRDQIQAELAQPQNKKDEAQQALHEKLRQSIAKVLQENGYTDQQYQRLTFVVSTDPEQRRVLDDIMGIKPPAPPPAPAASANPVRTHFGHLMTGFNGTPDGQGLLPTAVAEAKVVSQHAALAVKSANNLDMMKVHAGHVLHALDPGEAASGPGLGYGLKKAALAVVTHIELAAKVQAVSNNVTTHAVHIAVAARNTVQRADQILALAKQIQAASSATEAAELVTKLNTLAEQLITGADANGDGRIGWQEGEGGLEHVEQHINLMMQAEGSV